MRFELTTFSLARRRSTTELHPLAKQHSWGRWDSNPHGLLHVILNHARLPVPTLPPPSYYTINRRFVQLRARWTA